MRPLIADTGPINYLILISQIEILPALFDVVILPSVVLEELRRTTAPPAVRKWIADLPSWIEVRTVVGDYCRDSSLKRLDAGEGSAIQLAIELQAELLLMDDRGGVIAARRKGFRVAGTLGVLNMAAERKLVDLADVFERLKQTNFHYRQELMDQFLNERRS